MAPDTDRRQSDGSHRCADGAHRMRVQRQHHPEVENPPDLSQPSPAGELPIPDQVKLEVAVRRERVAVATGAALWDGRRGRRVRKRERGQRQRGHHAAARDVGVSLGRLCRRRRGECAGRGHRDPVPLGGRRRLPGLGRCCRGARGRRRRRCDHRHSTTPFSVGSGVEAWINGSHRYSVARSPPRVRVAGT